MFLFKGAILRVTIPTHISNELDRNRLELIPEDLQKKYVQDVQNMQASEVVRQLEDFRQKRMMGMTPNEQELSQVENHYQTDRVPLEMKEKAVAELLLERFSEANPSIVADEERFTTILTAVSGYMKHLGVKTRAPDNKRSRGFFKWKNEKKSRVIPVLQGWIQGNNDPKPLIEGDKGNPDRKGSGSGLPHRGSGSEGSTFPFRKQTLPGPGTGPVAEAIDTQHNNIITITPSPESTQSDAGVTASRPDQSFVPDAGDISPISTSAGLSLVESASASDINLEDSHDKESPDVTGVLPEGPLPASGSGPSLQQQEEVEPRLLELEQDPPNWRELASSDVLSKLSKKEMKRQEVINELFATEHAHVRMLSVLQTVFYRPMGKEDIMHYDELDAIFPSLDELIDLHYAFYDNLKKLRQEDGFVVKIISTPVLSRFNGSEGVWFQKLAARFCSHQSWALDQIKSRQKKDPRFNAFILDAESKPQCRRLQLKDIIPIEMQRLTKYPLLLENIAKSTEDNAERENIQQAADCCRMILNHVNEEVKHMENLLTIKDYQRRLDTSGLKPSNELYLEYKNFDLTSRRTLYEGPLTWKVTKEKAIDVQGVLREDLLVLLQKQDDKMVLKCQSKSIIAAQEGKQMLSPIIKLNSVFLREVATDRRAFYVIFTWDSGAQIYELVAQSSGDRKMWTDVIKSAVDELKKSGGPTLDRTRHGSMPAGGTAMHYNPSLVPPLSPTENGADLLKNNAGRDKDKLTDEKSSQSQTSVIDYLAAVGFDPIGHTNSPPERSAAEALNEVMSLKRMLVSSISLSEDPQPDDENGASSPKQDTDTEGSQSTEEQNTDGQQEEKEGKAKPEEMPAIVAPLVLSHESIEEVRRKLDSLEDKLKKLQNVEEEYHRLQEALAKFTIQRGSYN